MTKQALTQLYLFLLKTHRRLSADKYKSQLPVISIGNLTVGGTGKTPFSIFLGQLLHRKGHAVTVVTRAYKGKTKKPQDAGTDWRIFGDETVLIKKHLDHARVVCGPKKWQTVKWCDEQGNDGIYLIDDGFQHWPLERDMDIILLDASVKSRQLLPFGRLREPISAVARANLVVITKTDLISDRDLSTLKKQLVKYDVPVCCFRSENVVPVAKEDPVLLVTGVANPKAVQKSLIDYNILDHMVFPDHHSYTSKDWDAIQKRMDEVGAKQILTTEKDYVKFESSWQPVKVLSYSMVPKETQDEETLSLRYKGI